MLAMFLAYKLFMSGDNQPAFNRGILLSIYAVSFLLPLAISFPETSASGNADTLADIDFTAKYTTVTTMGATPVWGTILLWVFIAGMTATALRTLIIYMRILRVISRGERIDKGSYTLVLTESNNLSPFSWMRYMVMSRRDYETCGDVIVTHELRHITARHCIDLLIAQLAAIVNWFNPAAWLMRDELMLVHEYQADMSVIDSGNAPKDYQLILIKKAVGARFPSLANSLNHSKLKKRITMMYKSKSSGSARMKVIALVPAAALALLIAAAPKVKAAISTIENSEMLNGKVNEIGSNTEETTGETYKLKNINNNDGKTTVTISGIIPDKSLSVDGVKLTTGGKTYDANGINCSMKNGEATIIATFPFLDEFDNVTVTLSANGRTVDMNIEPYFPGAPATKENNEAGKSSISGMTIYVDGKKVEPEYINSISPSDIESMKIEKDKNAIFIVTIKK